MSQFDNNPNVVDIDMEKIQKRLKFIIPIVILIFVIIIGVMNSVYMIENKQNGVVLRFGRVNELVVEPGLHFKIPFAEKVVKVDVGTFYRMEYGFRTQQSGTTTSSPVYSSAESETQVIVDGNNNNASIALIELIIQYQVKDAINYSFKVDDVEGTLRLALEDVVRTSVQSLTLDQVKNQKEVIDEAVLPLLQKKLDDYEVGIDITLVATQNVSFLPSVETAYQEKENANQYKNGKGEDAEKYANTVLPQANAEAVQLIEEANAYRASNVANANAGVAQFNALYNEYLNNPEIVQERYYLDAMTQFFINNKIIIDGSDSGDVYKFYNLDDSAIKQDIVN